MEGEKPLVADFRFNMPYQEIEKLLGKCDTWVSVDSFLPHVAYHLKKPGIVIWSVSDPKIFGYPQNRNLLKDRKYLRKNQFDIWEAHSLVPDSFVEPEIVRYEVRRMR